MKRIDQLTFTRFFAILLVVFYHGGGGIYLGSFDKWPISAIVHSAPTAVSYLYVLSGFVMAIVYYRPKEKFKVLEYWTARFVRIYPLYIISFLLVCLYYSDYIARIKPWKIISNLFVVQAWWPPYAQSFNYSSWSMTVEFFFYAIFPFFIMWAYRQSTRKLIAVSIVLWVVSQLVHYTLWVGYFPAWELFVVYNPIFHLNSFIMGVVGGIWFFREGRDAVVDWRLNSFLLALSLVLLGGYAILSNVYTSLPHDLQPMAGLLAPLFVLFTVTLARDNSVISKVLSHKWLVTLGETAFALYIIEVPFEWFYKRALENSTLQNPTMVFDYTSLPILITLGLISYLYIDPPLRNFLKNIMKRISMPLLVLDLAIISLSLIVSFRLRFGIGREYYSYRNTMLLMFWCAFLLRPVISIILNGLKPDTLYLPILQMIRPLLLSVTIGTVVVAVLVYVGYSTGQVENFPRSIFFIDWAIILGLSFLVRYLFRLAGIYAPKPLTA